MVDQDVGAVSNGGPVCIVAGLRRTQPQQISALLFSEIAELRYPWHSTVYGIYLLRIMRASHPARVSRTVCYHRIILILNGACFVSKGDGELQYESCKNNVNVALSWLASGTCSTRLIYMCSVLLFGAEVFSGGSERVIITKNARVVWQRSYSSVSSTALPLYWPADSLCVYCFMLCILFVRTQSQRT